MFEYLIHKQYIGLIFRTTKGIVRNEIHLMCRFVNMNESEFKNIITPYGEFIQMNQYGENVPYERFLLNAETSDECIEMLNAINVAMELIR